MGSAATITHIRFSVIWVTTYPAVVAPQAGLVTRSRYSDWLTQKKDYVLPWFATYFGEQHRSQFWFRYMGSTNMRTASPDACWEHVVPFARLSTASVRGTAGITTDAQVLLYPTSLAVVITVDAVGSWPIRQSAAAISALRDRRDWVLTREGQQEVTGKLDRLASALRADVQPAVGLGPSPSGSESIFTVATPLGGRGSPERFALTEKDAAGCVAALAALSPTGTLAPAHLFAENTSGRYAARIYALKDGHTIWHPALLLSPPADDALACFHANQTAAVTQIAALSAIASEACDALAARTLIPVANQDLVRRAQLRLQQLQVGHLKSYRSEIGKARIADLASCLAAIAAGL
jgi:hypothetical protein